jgi:hypothetical protein
MRMRTPQSVHKPGREATMLRASRRERVQSLGQFGRLILNHNQEDDGKCVVYSDSHASTICRYIFPTKFELSAAFFRPSTIQYRLNLGLISIHFPLRDKNV